MRVVPDCLRDDAWHERSAARALPKMRWVRFACDLRAEAKSVQLFQSDPGEIREGLSGARNCHGEGSAEGLRTGLATAAGCAQPVGRALARSKARLSPPRYQYRALAPEPRPPGRFGTTVTPPVWPAAPAPACPATRR